MASSSTSRDQDLAFLIVQFLEEHNFTESARMLEKEGKLYFSMKYVEEAVTDGKWKELEDYILSFTKINDNPFSHNIIFEIRRHKYIEALDNGLYANALEILRNELRMFAAYDADVFNEMAGLLYLNNIRENIKIATYYVDTKTARCLILARLKQMIEMNPVLKMKLNYPTLEDSRLKVLMNQSLNWHHVFCEYPDPNPTVSTLYVDHTCADAVVLSLNDGDCGALANLTPSIIDERKMSINPEIIEQAQLYSLRLHDPQIKSKIDRLTYNNSGDGILALSCDGGIDFWLWVVAENNVTGKATPRVVPPLCKRLRLLAKDTSPGGHGLAVPCFSLSKNGAYLTSASGGKVSLFNLKRSLIMATFMSPPPAATSVMFYPEDNNIIIMGMEDGSIQIHEVREDEVIANIRAHQKRVTGLAYSSALNILVSSGYDAQICAWNKIGWFKQSSNKILDNCGLAVPPGHTRVQFHQDQKHLLVVHEICIATFEGPNLNHCKQWIPGEILISDAVYSCDGQSIYTRFVNGQIFILDSATYTPRSLINPAAYLPSNPSSVLYACALAAHPTKHNQFALGLSDGGILVVEPREGDWPGSRPQLENVAGCSTEISLRANR